MRKKLYGNDIEPRCGYCANGRAAADGQSFMCAHKGYVDPFGSCRRFRYDPLKRIPETPRKNPKRYSTDDFSME